MQIEGQLILNRDFVPESHELCPWRGEKNGVSKSGLSRFVKSARRTSKAGSVEAPAHFLAVKRHCSMSRSFRSV